MNDVLVDAGPLAALLDRRDKRNPAVRAALASCRGTVYTTWPALTEASHIVGRSDMRLALIEMVRQGALRLARLDSDHFVAMARLHATYRDRNPDLADLSIVVAAEILGITTVLTFDRDFHVYRTSKGRTLDCPILEPGT